ncbi:MAG TPA: hypothetical protein IAC02_02335 [Candidatus Coprovivens excrementavium]|nr:hypothetical protein [Candidatus Coprovivens excrementavium]
MVVSKQLKKQIIIEILALIFLIAVLIYAFFAIKKNEESKITNLDGMVVVVDDTNVDKIKGLSDGEGLSLDGTTYTITNNNKNKVNYKIVLVPNVHDEKVLKQVRISTDDLYVENLTDLERLSGGYVIASSTLDSGFTDMYLIKYWYKLDSDQEVLDEDIDFEYRLVKES